MNGEETKGQVKSEQSPSRPAVNRLIATASTYFNEQWDRLPSTVVLNEIIPRHGTHEWLQMHGLIHIKVLSEVIVESAPNLALLRAEEPDLVRELVTSMIEIHASLAGVDSDVLSSEICEALLLLRTTLLIQTDLLVKESFWTTVHHRRSRHFHEFAKQMKLSGSESFSLWEQLISAFVEELGSIAHKEVAQLLGLAVTVVLAPEVVERLEQLSAAETVARREVQRLVAIAPRGTNLAQFLDENRIVEFDPALCDAERRRLRAGGTWDPVRETTCALWKPGTDYDSVFYIWEHQREGLQGYQGGRELANSWFTPMDLEGTSDSTKEIAGLKGIVFDPNGRVREESLRLLSNVRIGKISLETGGVLVPLSWLQGPFDVSADALQVLSRWVPGIMSMRVLRLDLLADFQGEFRMPIGGLFMIVEDPLEAGEFVQSFVAHHSYCRRRPMRLSLPKSL